MCVLLFTYPPTHLPHSTLPTPYHLPIPPALFPILLITATALRQPRTGYCIAVASRDSPVHPCCCDYRSFGQIANLVLPDSTRLDRPPQSPPQTITATATLRTSRKRTHAGVWLFDIGRHISPLRAPTSNLHNHSTMVVTTTRSKAISQRFVFITLILLLTLLATRTYATTCMSSALMNVKLAAYAVRAIAYGVPRNAVWCVHRAVRAERLQHITVGDKHIECMSSKRLTTLIGSSLPECVARYGGAHRGTHQARRPVAVTTKLVPTSERYAKATRLRLPFTMRRQCRDDNWCHCYCNSGCHYCCSALASGVPGNPTSVCFNRIGCTQKRLQKC